MFALMEIAVLRAASNISFSKGCCSLLFPSVSTKLYLTTIGKVCSRRCIRRNGDKLLKCVCSPYTQVKLFWLNWADHRDSYQESSLIVQENRGWTGINSFINILYTIRTKLFFRFRISNASNQNFWGFFSILENLETTFWGKKFFFFFFSKNVTKIDIKLPQKICILYY